MKSIFLSLLFLISIFKINAQNLTIDQLLKIKSLNGESALNYLNARDWKLNGSSENPETGDETFLFIKDEKILTLSVGIENLLLYQHFNKGIESVLINRTKQLGYKLIKSTTIQGINFKIFSNGSIVILFGSQYVENYDKYSYITMIMKKSIYDKKLKAGFK